MVDSEVQITKKCPKCKIEKSITSYFKDKSKNNGYSSWCKECSQTRVKNRRKQIRIKIKEGKHCLLCKESNQWCLDFHHVLDKDTDISNLVGGANKKVEEEISKCIILCANHHRKLQWRLLDYTVLRVFYFSRKKRLSHQLKTTI